MTAAVGIAQSGVNNVSWRNRIINGGMVIDQRNAGASVTPTNGAFTLDRWQAAASQPSKFSVQRDTAAPAGFSNSLKVTSLSAYSVGTSEAFRIQQSIEGFNIADLAWGTASAQAATLSFRVYSSLTGTFGGSISDSVSGYSYPLSYTVPVANTWTTVSVSITGPTSGTWGSTNGVGLVVIFSLGAGASVSAPSGAWISGFYASSTGATSVVGTNGATFYITGVQLERGTTATPFEYRDYGRELLMCQRYYVSSGGELVGATSGNPIYFLTNGQDTGTARGYAKFPVTMRTTPTVTIYNNETGTAGGVVQNGVSYLTNCTAQAISINGFGFYQNNNNNFQTSVRFISAFYFASAEL